MSVVRRHFRPEFLNRLDDIVLFQVGFVYDMHAWTWYT